MSDDEYEPTDDLDDEEYDGRLTTSQFRHYTEQARARAAREAQGANGQQPNEANTVEADPAEAAEDAAFLLQQFGADAARIRRLNAQRSIDAEVEEGDAADEAELYAEQFDKSSPPDKAVAEQLRAVEANSIDSSQSGNHPDVLELGNLTVSPELEAKANELAELGRVLGHPVRAAIFLILSSGRKLGPSELSRLLRRARPTISEHLTALEETGLLKCEPSAKARNYHVDPERLGRFKHLVAGLPEPGTRR